MRGSESIIDHFKDRVLRIPVYQRSYNWKRENCKRLLDDLSELARHGNTRKHFFGTIIYQIDTHTDERIIIDGQQRITTVALLLAAIRDLIDDGTLKTRDLHLSEEIGDWLIDRRRETVYLHLVEEDAEAYEKLIRNRVTTENSRIYDNYAYLCDRIKEMTGITADDLYRSINNLHVMIVRLSIEDGDDPQAVFESINSTGLSLTEGDRIRNYILMNADPEEQDRIYSSYWRPVENDLRDDITRFFRDYLIAVTADVPKKDEVYAAFRNFAERAKEDGTYGGILKSLPHYSGIYRRLTASDLDDISKEASAAMYHINYIEAGVAYPFIMHVIDLHIGDPAAIPSGEVTTVLRILENMLVRRLICGTPSNALNKLFPPMFKSIRSMEGDAPFSEKLKYLLLRKEGGSRYPRDAEVIGSLKAIDLYDRRKTCAVTLALLENANRDTADTLKRIESRELTIEHVMPQNPSEGWRDALGPDYEAIREEWTHRLGNLTLTAYNSEYSNRTYREKRELKDEGFLESGLKLNRYMKEHEDWGVSEMSERNDLLAERFISVVPELRTDFAPAERTDEFEAPLSSDRKIFTGNKVIGYVLQGNAVRCKNATDAYLKLLTDLCRHEPEKMAQIVSLSRPSRHAQYIGEQPGDYWGRIGDNLYAYWHSDTETKIRVLKQIVEQMGIDPEDVKIIVKPMPKSSASKCQTE